MEKSKAPDSTKERVGINAVENIILNDFGWFFREQPVSDYGIDAHIEEMGDDNRPTGKLIALQIKSGASYFKRQKDGYIFYGEPRHLEYWTNHSLPVFIILHNPETGVTLWQKVERRLAKVSDDGWSIVVPAENVLDLNAKQYFESEVAADPESARRFNMSFDLDLIKKIENREVYFEVNKWVNKGLNWRDIGVMFDEPDKDQPDFMIRFWAPAPGLFALMTRFFPWLDYEYEEIVDALEGEVEVHVIRVRLNELAKAYLVLENYYVNGPSARTPPAGPFLTVEEFEENDIDAM
jgi:hypothetical protein